MVPFCLVTCVLGEIERQFSYVKSPKRVRAKVDWAGLRMLFATGTTLDELAKMTGMPMGTIGSRSTRENWNEDRLRLKKLAEEARVNTHKALANMPERGRMWASRVAEQADRGLAVIEREPIETLKDVSRVTSVLDQVDKVARRSYGLDDEAAGQRTIVNLGFLQDYRPDDPVAMPATVEVPALTDEKLGN